jgi:hypothetical protein
MQQIFGTAELATAACCFELLPMSRPGSSYQGSAFTLSDNWVYVEVAALGISVRAAIR